MMTQNGLRVAISLMVLAAGLANADVRSGTTPETGLDAGSLRADSKEEVVVPIAAGTYPWEFPLHPWVHDSRTQVIYLADEVGTGGSITGLALDVSAVPDRTMNKWTIRMKHTDRTAYGLRSFDGGGWTVVYQNNETIKGTGWQWFEFQKPFDYDGTSNLLVDFSYNNDYFATTGRCLASRPGGVRSIYAYSDSDYGDPLIWMGAASPQVYSSSYVPNVQLRFSDSSKPEEGVGFKPRVLICGADGEAELADVRQKLEATQRFETVDVFDLRSDTPALVELQAFDAVMVYCSEHYDDAAVLGYVMADYVDTGGGVVCMMFEMGVPNTHNMRGRWNSEQYFAILRGGQYQGTRAVLGAVYDPEHPCMQGVTVFDGGPESFRPETFDVTADAVRIADWSDGRPLVATKTIGHARRVDLGFYPVSSDVDARFWDASTDGTRLMANALVWVARQAHFEDVFPSTTIDTTKWSVVNGATVDDVGIREPSGPYSLRLNSHPSGGDSVESRAIDLSGCSSATLTYSYERTGDGFAPEEGDDLIIEYEAGWIWLELDRRLGSGPDMTKYEQVIINLPRSALHAGFRFRIRTTGTADPVYIFDDWFVDDVKVEPKFPM